MKFLTLFMCLFVVSLNAETFTKNLDNIGWHMVGVPINSVTIKDSTFDTNANVVWKWNGSTQAWEFYSKNAALVGVAQSINVPIISTLNKGDALWVKTTNISNVLFENNITNTVISQNPDDYDTSVLKIGSSGQILPDDATDWKAVYIKEANLWVETKTAYTGGQKYTVASSQAYCSGLSLAGKDDWKLASVSELGGIDSIMATKSLFFPNIQTTSGTYYWSRDVGSFTGYLYYYGFYGNSANTDNSSTYYALCVRTVQ